MEAVLNFSFKGEFFSLASALIWAVAVILFRISGRTVHPLGLNLFKSILAAFLFIITMFLISRPLFPGASIKNYSLLLLSGVVGLGLSDTLLFACLNRLGASLTAIIDCSYSPFVIILATIFLSESMKIFQLLGVFLIITAVISISYEKNNMPIPSKVLLTGIALGITAMFTMAISIIIIKPILDKSSILWASLIRTIGGILFTGGALLVHPERRSILSRTLFPSNWKPMIPGSILGGYLALIAWMVGMKFTQASVASALNQMSTIFIFILGVIFLREGINSRKTIAMVMAIAGLLLVILF